MSQFYKVEISAETKEQADDILNSLLAKRLVTGGQMITAPARFNWKNKIEDMDYVTITSFTIEKHRQTIIDDVKTISIEEVPMISFLQIEGNTELLNWIVETVAK